MTTPSLSWHGIRVSVFCPIDHSVPVIGLEVITLEPGAGLVDGKLTFHTCAPLKPLLLCSA